MYTKWPVMAAGVILAGLMAACQTHQFQATILDPPKPIADFEMPSADGSIFKLSDHQKGLVVLFFGYTNCPDECPATLTQLKLAAQKLGAEASNVQVVFVTVDPARDTPDRLKEYLSQFDASFIGIRAEDPGQLKSLTNQFGIYYDLGTSAPGEAQPPIMHTTSVLVLKNMALKAIFPPATNGETMAADLHELLR